MAKETFYFSHDYNARQDEKIKQLIRKHGMTGYGIFWSIVEDLYNNANALRLDCEGIAFDMRVSENVIESIIYDFGLFIIDGDTFGSVSVERRMNERKEKSEKAKISASYRWSKLKDNANAMRTQTERNAIKEKKVNKGKEKKESKVKDSPPNGVHFLFIEAYSDFYLNRVGIKPLITGADGSAVKSLIPYLTEVSREKTENGALDSFKFILRSWDKLDTWHQGKIKLIEIKANINNILEQLKHPKNGKSKQDDEFAKAAKIFYDRHQANKL